jgi:predicted MFS family arabinose efflux permease
MSVAIVLTFLLYMGWIQIWHFLVLVFVVGSGQAFGGPAYQALIPGLVKKEDVPNAVALNSIQFNLARMVGPVAAGAVFAAFGATICFGLNALSFLAVIISLLVIKASFIPQKTTLSVAAQIKGGFVYMKQQGSLWQLTILGFVSTFCGVPLITLLPVFAKDVFGLGPSGYSTMMAISGFGSITGALIYASRSKMQRPGVFTLRVQVLFAFLLVAFALSGNLILSVILLFFTGACLISLFASITSLVQLAVTEEMRGRMMSIFMLAFRGGMPLGDLTAGYLAAEISPSFALIVLAIILAIVAVGFGISNSGVKKI